MRMVIGRPVGARVDVFPGWSEVTVASWTASLLKPLVFFSRESAIMEIGQSLGGGSEPFEPERPYSSLSDGK
jgi:hypothetical protein